MTKELDKGEKAEIMDLYDGTYTSIRYLAKLFKVGRTQIKWLVNYKDFKKKQTIAINKWQKENPEKVRKMTRKAGRIYRQRHPEKVKANSRKQYLRNRLSTRPYYSNKPKNKLQRIIKQLQGGNL